MTTLLEIGLGYIAIVYGVIPICVLICALFMGLIGLIVRCYYAIEDFLTGANNEKQ